MLCFSLQYLNEENTDIFFRSFFLSYEQDRWMWFFKCLTYLFILVALGVTLWKGKRDKIKNAEYEMPIKQTCDQYSMLCCPYDMTEAPEKSTLSPSC